MVYHLTQAVHGWLHGSTGGPKGNTPAHTYVFMNSQGDQHWTVSFQWKNPDFLLRNPDFVLRNPNFLLKNVEL